MQKWDAHRRRSFPATHGNLLHSAVPTALFRTGEYTPSLFAVGKEIFEGANLSKSLDAAEDERHERRALSGQPLGALCEAAFS